MKKLIIADASDIVRKVGKRILSAMDFDVTEVRSDHEAIFECTRLLPDVLIVDAAMEGALDLIRYIRSMPEGQNTRIYYGIIHADLKSMMAGKRAGADDFILKPFDRKSLDAVFADYAHAA